MKLYGSSTSPYVRRIRILLANTPYEFDNMMIFAGEDRARLKAKNPAMKVPMLEDGEQVIIESRIIARYLSDKLNLTPLTLDEENRLSLIDSVNESLVNLLLLQRSKVDTNQDILYFRIQHERLNDLFTLFDKQCEEGLYEKWDYLSISLLCTIDWVNFRGLTDLSKYQHLAAFVETNQHRDGVSATYPVE